MDAATFGEIPGIIKKIAEILLGFVGFTTLAMLIIGSIKLITSSGDAKKIQSAKNIFTYAIIGFMVVLFSYAIVRLVLYTTGVS